MNSQSQISLDNIINVFCNNGVSVNSCQLLKGLGGPRQSYAIADINRAMTALNLTQAQHTAISKALGSGQTSNGNALAAGYPNGSNWWNGAGGNALSSGTNNGSVAQLGVNGGNGGNVLTPTGNDWVIIMNSETFSHLAQSGGMKNF